MIIIDNNKTIRLIHVFGDDWEGIYVNNALWVEGHEILPEQWFRLGQQFYSEDFKNIATYEIGDGWLEMEGSLPEFFDKIPKDVLN